jgi:glycosyltransferase involved in cell wall biosynthesis
MNVLYVNHTGQVSGGEKSLLEILRALPGEVCPRVACPEGPLARAVVELGVERVELPGTDVSLKLHPWHASQAAGWMTRGALALRGIAREHDASVIHANSIRAGLLTALASRLGGPPSVVHVRDRLPSSRVSTLTLRTIGMADAVIANSHYTASSLTEAGVTGPVRVLSNPVDLERFDPAKIDRRSVRAALGLLESDFVATVLAQITPWKGQEDAVRALAEVRGRHPRAKLLLVGSAKFVSKATRYDNRAYLEQLHRAVVELGLEDNVQFLGERDDAPEILRATDVLLVPSWEEPFGRSVIEAMAMRVPVIATNVGGPAEVIANGEDGLLVAPRRPKEWAGAICELIESTALRDRLAENGGRRSRAFAAELHAEALMRVYAAVIAERAPTSNRLTDPLVGQIQAGGQP